MSAISDRPYRVLALALLLVAGLSACGPHDPPNKSPRLLTLFTSDRGVASAVVRCSGLPNADGLQLFVQWHVSDPGTGKPRSFMRMVSVPATLCGCAFSVTRASTLEFPDVPADAVRAPFGVPDAGIRTALEGSSNSPLPNPTDVDMQIWRDGDKIDSNSIGSIHGRVRPPFAVQPCRGPERSFPMATFNLALRRRFA
jgi:hypothetical protein